MGVERFILAHKNEENALNALKASLEWRKSFGINDLDDKIIKEANKTGDKLKNNMIKKLTKIVPKVLQDYLLSMGRTKRDDRFFGQDFNCSIKRITKITN